MRKFIIPVVLMLAQVVCAENARLPYSYLYRAQKTQADIAASYPDLEIVLRLKSISPDVHPGDIHVTINSKSGAIPLSVAADGAFSIPLRDDLLAEDPWVVTDQPRGTMVLNWKGGLAPRLVRQMLHPIHYAALMRPVQQCDEVQERMRAVFPDAPKLRASGLKLVFAVSHPLPMVLIQTRGGVREIKAGETGAATIPLDLDLLAEDPLMTFSDRPKAVELIFRGPDATEANHSN